VDHPRFVLCIGAHRLAVYKVYRNGAKSTGVAFNEPPSSCRAKAGTPPARRLLH
jgi:hypothetical protein